MPMKEEEKSIARNEPSKSNTYVLVAAKPLIACNYDKL